MTKHIVLCADDYSLNPAINAGIVGLLAQGRLSAVSCMTQSPTWAEDAKALLPWQDRADIGLHFNLSHPFANIYSLPLPQLMLQSSLRIISRDKIRDSIRWQLDAFEKAMGRAPDFIDGHHHVHIFPVIRNIIIKEYVARYGALQNTKPYMRSLENLPATTNNTKAAVLKAMGIPAYARLLKKHAIPHNSAFAGIYNFNNDENLDQLMHEWLNAMPDSALVMCHPAHKNHSNEDDIAYRRFDEFTYLSSEQFLQTMHINKIKLSRLN